MAMNPMQRRARNAGLIGALIATIIMSIIVLILLKRINSLNEAKEALESVQKRVYVAADDLESGDIITMEEDFIMDTVQTTMNTELILSEDDFEFYDEETGNIVDRYNEAGEKIYKELVMKIDVPAGTIVTKDMVVESGKETTNDERILEYNMIILPSQLKNGDYVDIRLSLPNGQDYIVLSKKRVEGTDATGLWMKVDELEIMTMNNAIVEAYMIEGAKLYALQYTEAGMQEKSIPTYAVSGDVYYAMMNNPNITDEAWKGLEARYNSEYRTKYMDSSLFLYEEDRNKSVESGLEDEIESIKAARQEFVDSLEGTEDIGYTR